ncbi:maleylacetoacetate isomerase [Roseobacter sp. HKCCD9010]|uniref:maleylacetoacetate isomerase n=1 Tax=unclassified Roseobacter TaxID=196798 RepID=UPI0014925361|nr:MULTISPECIES: maleylacetoacetate isomerase [unclassified Roseobacter]MBF9052378.1 maleylacetoacetate isomerase [Rhodobacterales bacterium HKCCD4356]NNV13707.1 maleylacetoacetate isomerase [Roseobacter sp. HKCCD7357]NNV18545.1 maleylacetoacetate isomerase [Roseobacter sp. HKCCD8768]NNV27996.1 maleylacetoacetate isomerase [Roseobacter sp. HKCCD8192]NNV32296.1 maleylacetoacetate isomerase [Roseobacter sp. HKCCD9061]
MQLHSYWRSTTAYRVRIALALKGLPYDTRAVDLARGDQLDEAYARVNPIAGVPTLVLVDGRVLTQSMAILDYLDRMHPSPPLLPEDPFAAAQVQAAAYVIACDIHPVNNLRVGARLKGMGHDQLDVVAWMTHWMRHGLTAYSQLLPVGPKLSFADTPTLADLCLIPQLYNARRWGVDLTGLERLTEVEQHCLALPAFAQAGPEAQPDAP